jgi:hypothetical protein
MVRPTIGNLIVVTGLSIVGIWGFKALMRMFPVKGLSDLAGGI